jgi:hypothetical protein
VTALGQRVRRQRMARTSRASGGRERPPADYPTTVGFAPSRPGVAQPR